MATGDNIKRKTTKKDGVTTTTASGTITGSRNVGNKVNKDGSVESVKEFNTPKGKRYYTGKGSSQRLSIAKRKADMRATFKYTTAPADSLPSGQVDSFLKGKKKKKFSLFGKK